MKFICITEQYRHYRGLLFAFGKPTEVKDQATIEALMVHPDFKPAEAKTVEQIPDVCPKCGKTVKRGKVLHAKYCKGPK